MQSFLVLLLLVQPSALERPTILARAAGDPERNLVAIGAAAGFRFVGRHYGRASHPQGNTEAGLFVFSEVGNRWIQVLAISTAGARFGTSRSSNPAARKKLSSANVSWDFTPYAHRPYIEQPLQTGGSIAFPESFIYNAHKELYELRYFSSWNLESAETLLLVHRADLVTAFSQSALAPAR